MFSVIIIALCGVVAGFGLRRWRGLQHVNQSITFTICFMLFVLGLSVGENNLIIEHLWQFGTQALLISVASMLGSVVCGWLLYRCVLKKQHEQ